MRIRTVLFSLAIFGSAVFGLDVYQSRIELDASQILSAIESQDVARQDDMTVDIDIVNNIVIPPQVGLEQEETGSVTARLTALQQEAESLRDNMKHIALNIESSEDAIAKYEKEIAIKEQERENNHSLAEYYVPIYYQTYRDTETRFGFVRAKSIPNMLYRYNTMNEIMERVNRVLKRTATDEKTLSDSREQLELSTSLYRSQLAQSENRYAELKVKEKEIEDYLHEHRAELGAEYYEAISKLRGYAVGGQYMGATPDGKFMYLPVTAPVTSGYGSREHPIFGETRHHAGVDFGVDYGTPVRSAAAGVIIMAGWYGGYGKVVMIDHGNGIVTLYGHNDKVLVSKGDEVVQGQPVALAGSTGNSTGPHCHFEVRLNGDDIDPYTYVIGGA